MKKLLCIAGASILLAACATAPTDSQADAQAHAACRDVDPPIGSHRVRRADCGAASQAQKSDEARRDVEILQQQQQIRTTGAKRGG
jgi:uncharacterized lipoprotein YajG